MPSARAAASLREVEPPKGVSSKADIPIALRFSPEAMAAIEQLSRAQGGSSVAEVIQRALGTDLFFLEARERGGRIIIEDEHGDCREVIPVARRIEGRDAQRLGAEHESLTAEPARPEPTAVEG